MVINGDAREVPEGVGVPELLGLLGLPEDRVAIERNREILPRASWAGTVVQAGDQLEIVHLVGGG